MCGGGSVLSRISTGVSNQFRAAVKHPLLAVADVATFGTAGVINENRKASASVAAGAASGFITSGGNPLGAVAGGIVGGVNSAVNKQSIATSAYQSALYGAAAGAVTAGVSALAASSKAATASAVDPYAMASAGTPVSMSAAPFSVATAGTGVAIPAAAPASFSVATAGTGVGQPSFLSSVASTVWAGTKSLGGTIAKTLLPAVVYQKVFGAPAPGDLGALSFNTPYGTVPADSATLGGLNPQTGVQLPSDQAAATAAAASPVLAGFSPWVLFLIIPGGLAVGVWWWHHRHRRK